MDEDIYVERIEPVDDDGDDVEFRGDEDDMRSFGDIDDLASGPNFFSCFPVEGKQYLSLVHDEASLDWKENVSSVDNIVSVLKPFFQVLGEDDKQNYAVLYWLLFGDESKVNSGTLLQEMQEILVPNTCNQVWNDGAYFYRCRTCQTCPSSSICVPCFQNGNHEGHDSVFETSHFGGCCDCGNHYAWKESGFCSQHGLNRVVDPVTLLPGHLQKSVVMVIDGLVKICIEMLLSLGELQVKIKNEFKKMTPEKLNDDDENILIEELQEYGDMLLEVENDGGDDGVNNGGGDDDDIHDISMDVKRYKSIGEMKNEQNRIILIYTSICRWLRGICKAEVFLRIIRNSFKLPVDSRLYSNSENRLWKFLNMEMNAKSCSCYLEFFVLCLPSLKSTLRISQLLILDMIQDVEYKRFFTPMYWKLYAALAEDPVLRKENLSIAYMISPQILSMDTLLVEDFGCVGDESCILETVMADNVIRILEKNAINPETKTLDSERFKRVSKYIFAFMNDILSVLQHRIFCLAALQRPAFLERWTKLIGFVQNVDSEHRHHSHVLYDSYNYEQTFVFEQEVNHWTFMYFRKIIEAIGEDNQKLMCNILRKKLESCMLEFVGKWPIRNIAGVNVRCLLLGARSAPASIHIPINRAISFVILSIYRFCVSCHGPNISLRELIQTFFCNSKLQDENIDDDDFTEELSSHISVVQDDLGSDSMDIDTELHFDPQPPSSTVHIVSPTTSTTATATATATATTTTTTTTTTNSTSTSSPKKIRRKYEGYSNTVEDVVLMLMEYPLQIQVFCAQVSANMWILNGFSCFSKRSIYKSHIFRECSDADLFLIQIGACILSPRHFLVVLQQRFAVWNWFHDMCHDPKEVLKPPSPKYISQAQGMTQIEAMLSLIINVFIDRVLSRQLLSSENSKKITRQEMLHLLACGNKTRSKLYRNFSSSSSLSDYENEVKEVLAEIATYSEPTDNNPGIFSLKPEFWSEYHSFYRHYDFSSSEKASERYREHCRQTPGKKHSSSRFAGKLDQLPLDFEQSLLELLHSTALAEMLTCLLDWILQGSTTLRIGFALLHIMWLIFDYPIEEKSAFDSIIHHKLVETACKVFNVGKDNAEKSTSDSPFAVAKEIHEELGYFLTSLLNNCSNSLLLILRENIFTEDPDSVETEEEEAKKRKELARQRQQAILKQLQKQQSDFWSNNKEDNIDEANEMHFDSINDNDSLCLFCKMEACPNNPLVCLGFAQKTSFPAVSHRIPFELENPQLSPSFSESVLYCPGEDENFSIPIVDKVVFSDYLERVDHVDFSRRKLIDNKSEVFKNCGDDIGVNVISCGHLVHSTCLKDYCKSVSRRSGASYVFEGMGNIIPRKGEVLCPGCRRVSNIVFPIDLKAPVYTKNIDMSDMAVMSEIKSENVQDSFYSMDEQIEETNLFKRIENNFRVKFFTVTCIDDIMANDNSIELNWGEWINGKDLVQLLFKRIYSISQDAITWDNNFDDYSYSPIFKLSLLNVVTTCICTTEVALRCPGELPVDYCKGQFLIISALLRQIPFSYELNTSEHILAKVFWDCLMPAVGADHSMASELPGIPSFLEKHYGYHYTNCPFLHPDTDLFALLVRLANYLPCKTRNLRNILDLISYMYIILITQICANLSLTSIPFFLGLASRLRHAGKELIRSKTPGKNKNVHVKNVDSNSFALFKWFLFLDSLLCSPLVHEDSSIFPDSDLNVDSQTDKNSKEYLEFCETRAIFELEEIILRHTTPFLRRCFLLLQSLYPGIEDGNENESKFCANLGNINHLRKVLDIPGFDVLDSCVSDYYNPKEGNSHFIAHVTQWCSQYKESFQINLEDISTDLHLCHSRFFSFSRMHGSCLIVLPNTFQDLLMSVQGRKCQKCDTVPRKCGVCLLCGTIVCLGNRCCYDDQERGEGWQHACVCGGGIGLFIMMDYTYTIILRGNKFSTWTSLYLDEFGEQDIKMLRGKPLFLSAHLYRKLSLMWQTQSFDHDSTILSATGLTGNGF